MPDHVVVAHVTIAGPFLRSTQLRSDVISEIRDYCTRRSAFEFMLGRVASFSTGVVYLVPEPSGPFAELMRWFADRWPEAPLYGGTYPGLPHVSIAADQVTAEQLADVVSAVQSELPIEAVAREMRLVLTEDRMWHPLVRFAFGGDP
jgi:2'-5' RNA ligase superfamily